MNQKELSRRDFLRLSGLAAGGLLLTGCGRGRGINPLNGFSTDVVPTNIAMSESATLILINGKVATMDPARTITSAVAIAGDRILAAGSDEEIQSYSTSQTVIIDLKGRTVTPGFVDAHNHLYASGLVGNAYFDANPPAVTTVQELQSLVQEGCRQKGSSQWVLGQGYITFNEGYPDKTVLDPVSPDNPVMLINQGGHMGTVNSYALALAGVTAATPDPPFGKFVRDEYGEPTGILINHSAMDVFRALWAQEVMTPEIMSRAVLDPQEAFISYGITTVGDVNIRGVDAMDAFFKAGRAGSMSLRGYILNTIEYYKEASGRGEAIDVIRFESDFLKFGGYKFLVDGAVDAAYTHQPHGGSVWNMATWDPEALKTAVSIFHEMGYQCAFHVIGDAAVDMALDAIEFAMNKYPRQNPRHRLEHVVLCTDSALDRMRDLGVVVSIQPQGVYYLGEMLIRNWGEERAQRMIPVRSILEKGIPLSISSDAPTLPTWYPPVIASTAFNRMTYTQRVLGPDQVLSVDEILYGYTMGGAFACYQEHDRGSIEAGKFADLVVWRLDPYSAKLPDMMAEHPIDLTLIGGETRFDRLI